jgi:hypothetical protein
MKTAMQEHLDLIKTLDKLLWPDLHNDDIIDKALEKEKKQIIEAVEDTRGNIVPRYFLKENLSGEEYYNRLITKNKHMKLSTEEIKQKLNSIKLCLMAHPDNEPHSEFEDRISTLDEIIDSLTPIELPSDEEIEEMSIKIFVRSIPDYEEGFIDGAKWLKKRILKQNK